LEYIDNINTIRLELKNLYQNVWEIQEPNHETDLSIMKEGIERLNKSHKLL